MSQPQTQHQQHQHRQKHLRKIKIPRRFQKIHSHSWKKNSHYPRNYEEIPTSEETLDLANLDGQELSNKLLSLTYSLLPGWDDVKNAAQLHLEPISGALTNQVFILTAPKAKKSNNFTIWRNQETTKLRKVILRIYGVGVESLFEREKELRFLKTVSEFNIGPHLLGIFKNGRFEEYLDCTSLTPSDLRNPETSRHIAKRMATLHRIVDTFPAPDGTVPELWMNIDKWYDLAVNVIASEAFQGDLSRLQAFDFKLLKLEIESLRKLLNTFNCPLVVAHNDTQYGNILRLNDKSNELVVVDFEYAGYNYASFDIANHFCEWMFDFHSSEPHVTHSDWYPDADQQANFLISYIETEQKLRGVPLSICEGTLKQIIKECDAFALASHVMWGLWGLVQAGQSHIQFNYFEYGMQRLEQFRMKGQMNKLI